MKKTGLGRFLCRVGKFLALFLCVVSFLQHLWHSILGFSQNFANEIKQCFAAMILASVPAWYSKVRYFIG